MLAWFDRLHPVASQLPLNLYYGLNRFCLTRALAQTGNTWVGSIGVNLARAHRSQFIVLAKLHQIIIIFVKIDVEIELI